MKLLGRAASINVRKVLWTCAEMALDPEREEPDMAAPALRRLNPNAMVPVLLDGDFVLWESNSICRYLAGREQRVDLLPTEPRARALVEQWMDWQAGELNNSWRYAFMSLVRRSPAHQDAGLLQGGVAGWNRHMGMLDERLAGSGPHVCGAAFTLADVVLGLSVQRWMMTDMDKPALPAVQAYYERLSERPGFMAHGRNGLP
ncbi:glutathione S-transferase N-terminal domain-containing protein [Paucibacter sp. PLA-PC-4]|uniref:glutathione S-transferase family protein n=1 Tax=Paucibacter sp. PLA-PC-4 TaxID=2993655 RepID=UPI00224958A0|nr:glutathione S-transferase N-terminal domain-containing protein [Paucibacter sp. PLA-PC-4]MCX2860440.1 glutathione S-transferase N-terminal domain-containing protein [Paucibacter sp. PLA-PC-4]